MPLDRRHFLATLGLTQLNYGAAAEARFRYRCGAPYLLNLYWTVAGLAESASEVRKFWEQSFGLNDSDREALDRLSQLLPRLRSRYQVWEAEQVLTPFTPGPMVGLFIAPMSTHEQRVQVAMATTADVGTVRGRMPELSFAEVNTVAGTCTRFLPQFERHWEAVAAHPTRVARQVAELLTRQQPQVDDFIARAARVYGVAGASPAEFQVHFVWSPRATGGQCTLIENHIICEISAGERPERFLLGVLHESCHHLSALVTASQKYRRSEAFLTRGAYFPLTLLEESLAASLAEGIGGRLLTPTLLTPEARWVDHHGGKVDTAAKSIVPLVRRLFENRESLDAAKMREVAARCAEALSPRPRDFTTICLVAGRKEMRDYLRAGISQGSGLRFGQEYHELEANAGSSQLPAWFNRLYLVSAASDLVASAPLAQRWSLPFTRDEFELLRGRHERFLLTRREGSRMEFLLCAPDDAGLRRACDAFKQLTDVNEGVQVL